MREMKGINEMKSADVKRRKFSRSNLPNEEFTEGPNKNNT